MPQPISQTKAARPSPENQRILNESRKRTPLAWQGRHVSRTLGNISGYPIEVYSGILVSSLFMFILWQPLDTRILGKVKYTI